MHDVLTIFLFLCLMIFGSISQRWYSAYLREKKEEKDYYSLYVMNLDERKESDLNRQTFISFIRFLFLLSSLHTFVHNAIRKVFKYISYNKKNVLSIDIIKVVKEK